MQGEQEDNEDNKSRDSADDVGSNITDNRQDPEREHQERHNNNLREGYVRNKDFEDIQRRLAEFEDI